MKNLAAIILVTAFAAISLPTTAIAQNNDNIQKKIDRNFKKLKKLPNARTRPGKVNGLAKKLVRFDPANAKRYYKTATIKYLVAFVKVKAVQLQSFYARTLTKAAKQGQISSALAKRLTRQTQLIEERIVGVDPTPTPTPYVP